MNCILIGTAMLLATMGGDAALTAHRAPLDAATNPETAGNERVPAQAENSDPRTAAEDRLDPRAFFERLVARYRALAAYSDLTSVVQITREAPGEAADDPIEPRRTETRMICDIYDGELRITTPGSQLGDRLRQALGQNMRIIRPDKPAESRQSTTGIGRSPAGPEGRQTDESLSPAAEPVLDVSGLPLQYQLWLAPHMALKFADRPLEEFRAGVREPFSATEAAPVTIDEKVMVHVELRSGPGAGASADFDAKFDLYVNPESMLIERIDGQQRLPDGGSVETSMTIVPVRAEGVVEPSTCRKLERDASADTRDSEPADDCAAPTTVPPRGAE